MPLAKGRFVEWLRLRRYSLLAVAAVRDGRLPFVIILFIRLRAGHESISRRMIRSRVQLEGLLCAAAMPALSIGLLAEGTKAWAIQAEMLEMW